MQVEDADRTFEKISARGRWQPEQLDKSLWDQYKRKYGQVAWYTEREDKTHVWLRACCDGAALKTKCADPLGIRGSGVDPDYVLDPETEELILHWWKTKIMQTNRVHKSAYTPEDILAVLSEEQKAVASEFIALAEQHALKPELRYVPGHKAWKCAYTLNKPRRIMLTLKAAPGEFGAKACLFHIEQYLSKHNLPDTIKAQMVFNVWDCGSAAPSAAKAYALPWTICLFISASAAPLRLGRWKRRIGGW